MRTAVLSAGCVSMARQSLENRLSKAVVDARGTVAASAGARPGGTGKEMRESARVYSL
jgi:hypothetical protein